MATSPIEADKTGGVSGTPSLYGINSPDTLGSDSTNDEALRVLQQATGRLDEATAQGLLQGIGGKVPSPRKKAANRSGESISDTVSENRE